MPYAMRRAFFLACSSSLVAGCTTVDAAREAAVRYNSAFADARNEVLLINILRARDQVPLQFSTISTVTGPMRANIDVTSALEWVFHGTDKLTPGGTFTFRNPQVTIDPLQSKEFLKGMMQPLTAVQVDDLVAQGWDRAAVLNLAIAGVTCPNNKSYYGRATVLNDGIDDDVMADFERVATNSSEWEVGSVKDTPVGRFEMKSAEAAKVIKEGLGDDYKASLPERQKTRSSIDVQIDAPGATEVHGLHFSKICGTPAFSDEPALYLERRVGPKKAEQSDDHPKVFFRSPAAMIAYLGRLMAAGRYSPFFTVEYASPASAVPATAPIRATFPGYGYFIPAAGKRRRTNAYGQVVPDETLQTFAILTEVIALQTTQATLDASKPALTISAD